jgi:Ca2+-binding EF-hand superfamily protein
MKGCAMASGFQRSKIARVFAAMDADDDGVLVRADFEALSGRWTRLRGHASGSAGQARLDTIMMGWWSALSAGAGGAERITIDDVLRLVDRLPAMSDSVAATATAMFDAVDENGDEEISAAEYHQLIEAWNGRPTDTDGVFHLLDLDGDGHVSRAEFTRLWTEFWAGDDPDAPGTWVFGDFDLPVTHSG